MTPGRISHVFTQATSYALDSNNHLSCCTAKLRYKRNTKMKRRDFTKVCTSIVIAAGTQSSSVLADTKKVSYQRCLLQGDSSGILTVDQITVGEPYLFFYPFVTTPCLLINTGKPLTTDENSQWRGGIGPDKSIVAYSAICSHKMSHPAKEISFINYRHDPITYFNHEEGKSVEQSGLISCCSERSVYDPSQGAKVLGGPAPHPLAAIELEYDDSNGQIYAAGSYGADMYDRFFDKFGFRASMEHKISDPKTLSKDKVSVVKLSDYTRQTIKC